MVGGTDGSAGWVWDLTELNEPPTHLEGLGADNAITFLDWRHRDFLRYCDHHRGGKTEDGYPWVLGVVNGCFDLMHLGHLNFLHQAVEYETRKGHIFLVALLNTDASVGRLKGLHRPIIPLPARMWTVAMQRGVQGAAGFDEDTPAEALARLKPDFLFKGEEYRGTDIPGVEHCGEVVFFPETPGFRTTDIEKRIVAAAGTLRV